jgi:hypothetical protein
MSNVVPDIVKRIETMPNGTTINLSFHIENELLYHSIEPKVLLPNSLNWCSSHGQILDQAHFNTSEKPLAPFPTEYLEVTIFCCTYDKGTTTLNQSLTSTRPLLPASARYCFHVSSLSAGNHYHKPTLIISDDKNALHLQECIHPMDNHWLEPTSIFLIVQILPHSSKHSHSMSNRFPVPISIFPNDL